MPSVSTIKSSRSVDWTNATIKRIAEAFIAAPREFAARAGDVDALKRHLRELNDGGLDRAGARGTGVHLFAEHLFGLCERPQWPDAEPFFPALEAWFARYAPTLRTAEAVIINETLGFGGTFDAIVAVDGVDYLVDWKTRGNGHRVDALEALQLGGYAMAELVATSLDDYATLRPAPPMPAMGLVVSITTESVRTYPVDLAVAARGFRALHANWLAVQAERESLLDSWGTIKIAAPATSPKAVEQRPVDVSPSPTAETSAGTFEERLSASVSALRAQIAAMSETDRRVLLERWPAGVSLRDPATLTPERVSEVEQLIAEVESFGDVESVAVVREYVERAEPWRPSVPDEGEHADDGAVRAKVESLTGEQREWIAKVGQQSRHAGLSWHLSERSSLRRVMILAALCLAAVELDRDEPSLRGLLAHIHGGDRAWAPDVTLGTLVGALSAADAVQLESLIDAASDGRMSMRVSADGRVEWSFAT